MRTRAELVRTGTVATAVMAVSLMLGPAALSASPGQTPSPTPAVRPLPAQPAVPHQGPRPPRPVARLRAHLAGMALPRLAGAPSIASTGREPLFR